jgi:putative ABC transport system permease protein
MLVVALKRLFAQRGLALAVTAGLIATAALAASLPMYADAVNYRVLQTELSAGAGSETGLPVRSPFAFMFRYIGSWHGPLETTEIEPIDSYLSGAAGAELGLPRKLFVRHFATDKLQLFPAADIAAWSSRKPLEWLSLGSISDIETRIKVVDGRFPAVSPVGSEDPIEAMIAEPLAARLGLQVGETYVLLEPVRGQSNRATTQALIRIAGIWQAVDPNDDFWFYRPQGLEDLVLIPEATFLGRISSSLRNEIYLAVWYLVMDGSSLNAGNADAFLSRIITVQQRATGFLAKLSLDISPTDALIKYQRKTLILSILLYAFSVPIIGLMLTFIGLVAGLAVERQRNEIAVFRSRGATLLQVLGITLVEGLLLSALGLGLGILAARELAGLIGRTRTFLDFSLEGDLRVMVTDAALRLGLVVLGLTLLAQLAPALSAARHTIVTYKQERARALRPPWWQRAYLDFLLLIPAAYGAYVLRKQGALVLPVVSATLSGAASAKDFVPNDPFQNPLLFLVPALGLFAMTLVVLRLLPPIMAGISWLIGRTKSVGALLTARHLARTQSAYAAPLALLIMTIGLSAYTASLAQTLDDHTFDHAYYSTGADMHMVEMGQSKSSGLFEFGGGGAASTAAAEEDAGPEWTFLPVSEHLRVPGVRAAARVARYIAAAPLSGRNQKAIFIGVDRVDFSRVAFWRRDFAPANLGALMNALATSRNAILVSANLLSEHALSVGDRLRLTIQTPLRQVEVDMKIAGYFDLFPTWYPADGPLFVGNLDYLFEMAGGQIPYDVWLSTDPAQAPWRIEEGVRDAGFRVITWESSSGLVRKEERRPERQGLFGLLSVGFAAAAVLTVLGFMLYALFSFRRRFIELGVLRAIGLSSSQMTVLLASELAFLILTGLVMGTVLGSWASNLFIPYMQVGGGATANVPPYVVMMPWPTLVRIYLLMGVLFLTTLSLLAAMLLRMRIFQAVKLGETA